MNKMNPMAIYGYNPHYIEATSVRGGVKQYIRAYRSGTSGRYTLYTTLLSPADILAIPGVSPKNDTYELIDVYRVIDAAGAELSDYIGNAEFLAQQSAVLLKQVPDTDAVQALRHFEVMLANDLLYALRRYNPPSSTAAGVQAVAPFSGHTISWINNPLRAYALRKGKQGVFVWPDWRDERYVNVVIKCDYPFIFDVREIVADWCELHQLRFNQFLMGRFG